MFVATVGLVTTVVASAGASDAAPDAIRAHLLRVVATLSEDPPLIVDERAFAARLELLEVLNRYALDGRFPENRERAGSHPVFVDQDGTACAVGHLMRASGAADLANAIAASDNFVALPAPRPAVGAWARANGFLNDELALIQPSYNFKRPFDDTIKRVCRAAHRSGAHAARRVIETAVVRDDDRVPLSRYQRHLVAEQALECLLTKHRPTIGRVVSMLKLQGRYQEHNEAGIADGLAALRFAVHRQRYDLIRALAKRSDLRPAKGLVYAAIKAKDARMAKLLVRSGAPLNHLDKSEALHAAGTGQIRLATWLLKHGAAAKGEIYRKRPGALYKLFPRNARVTLVQIAIEADNLKLLNVAIAAGAEVTPLRVGSRERLKLVPLREVVQALGAKRVRDRVWELTEP